MGDSIGYVAAVCVLLCGHESWYSTLYTYTKATRGTFSHRPHGLLSEGSYPSPRGHRPARKEGGASSSRERRALDEVTGGPAGGG